MSDNDTSNKKPRPHLRSISSEKPTLHHQKFTAWLNHCQEVAVNQASLLFEEFSLIFDHTLNDKIDKSKTNQEHLIGMDNLREFRANSDRLKQYFSDKLNDGFVLYRDKSLATHLREHDPKESIWSLIDNDELEETIAIKTIADASNVEYQEGIWQLEKRLSSIDNSQTVNEHNNPISPLQFCVALRSSLSLISVTTASKLSAYKVFASLIDAYLDPLYTTTNEYLISEGILPNLRYDQDITQNTYDVQPNQESNPKFEGARGTLGFAADRYSQTSGDTEESARAAKEDEQVKLVNAIRTLLQQTRQYGADEFNEPPPVVSETVSEIALRELNHTGNRAPQPPSLFVNQQIIDVVENIQSSRTASVKENQQLGAQSIYETNKQIAAQLAKEASDGQVDQHDMYTIDLVGILFEYILTDESLPDSVKTLLSHLHTPFLKLAFIDTQFFEKPEHPARLLLDSLAEAGANYVNNDGSALYEMFDEIKSVVMRVMDEFKNDVRLFAEVLFEFNRLKNKLHHKHQLKERNNIERVQGQERLRLAKKRSKQELETRVKEVKLPSAVIQLLRPWFTYLTLLQLRDSGNEALWKQALRVVDELVYFFDFSDKRRDRSELGPRFNGILAAIKIGFNTMGYDQASSKKTLVDLTALKIATVKKYAATAAQKTDINGKTEPIIIAKPLPIKELEPIVHIEEQVTPEEEKVIDYLKLIEAGTWFEFDQHMRLKVNGFSSKLKKFMLVDSSSQKVVMISRLELARKIIAGEAKVVAGSTKPLFERALEKIFQRLDDESKSLN
ncbi:MAG: hypothetical protein ACI80S_000510 [Pseudohongiellaceae bacterium]|jgi:hypothetical protein